MLSYLPFQLQDLQCYWPKFNAAQKVKRLEIADTQNWSRFRVRVFTHAGM